MTPEQRKLFIALVVINLLACCIGLPLAIVWLDVGGTRTLGQALVAALLPTPRPTLTPRPTSSPTRPVPTPTLVPGWKLHTVAAEGFSIALPATYEELATSDETAWKAAVAPLQKKNPKLFAILKSGPALPETRFYAVDMSPTALVDNAVPIAFVLRVPDSPAGTVDDYISESAGAIKTACGSEPVALAQGRRKLVVGDAGFFRCRIAKWREDGTPATMMVTQYYWIRGTDLYWLVFGHPPKLDGKYLSLEDKIADTLRWINK
jgi:hypothetical protein